MNVDTPHDTAWFEAMFRATSAQVRRYVARRTTPDRVDDVVAETYGTAWASRQRLEGGNEEMLPWLYRTAANHLLHATRSHARSLRLSDKLAATSTPDHHPDPLDLIQDPALHGLFAGLSPVDAEVLRLAAWEDLTPKQIAEVLGITPGTARIRLFRARRRAAQLLGVQTPEPEDRTESRSNVRSLRTRPTARTVVPTSIATARLAHVQEEAR